jgi:hypothetical protein
VPLPEHSYGAGLYGGGLYGHGSTITSTDLATWLNPPYNWMVAQDGKGVWQGQRRQEGGMVRLSGTTQQELADKIAAYEAYVAARGTPISPEWGQVYGPTANDRRKLVVG